MQYTKKDDFTLVKTDNGMEYEYTLSFLNEQLEAITKQRDEMISAKESELAEVQFLKDKCTELGIISEEN